MSVCPQCGGDTADGSVSCTRCAAPAVVGTGADAPVEAPANRDSRFPFWQVLPWCLFAAALLLLLPHLRPHHISAGQPAGQAVPAQAAAAPPTPVPISTTTATTAAPVPLSVTLDSTADGKHVHVGSPVVISAYAALPAGSSATLAVSYGKNNGPKTLLSLAQGSLCSTTWTPFAPGRYQFDASALDSRKTSVFSRTISIWVDALPFAQTKLTQSAQSASPQARTQRSAVHLRTAERLTAEARHPARHFSAQTHTVHSVPAKPQPYHVAAATFPVRHIADTLAGALRRRGFHAFVRPGTRGKSSAYTVETGDYFSQADAQKQMRLLQRDGYPSYLYHPR